MNYSNLFRFSDADFKRLLGVSRPLFSKMIEIIQSAEQAKKKSGRPHTLSIEDQVVLTFNYLRAYRTQIELAADFGIAESNVNRTIRKIENALVQSRQFALPKRNQAFKDNDFVIIDVTESSIECPKKTE